MWFLPLAIECCKIALIALILYYVVAMIEPMPVWARQVCQVLIVALAILAVLSLLGGQPVRASLPAIPPGPSPVCKDGPGGRC